MNVVEHKGMLVSNCEITASLIFNNYYLQNTNEGGGFEIVNSFVELNMDY